MVFNATLLSLRSTLQMRRRSGAVTARAVVPLTCGCGVLSSVTTSLHASIELTIKSYHRYCANLGTMKLCYSILQVEENNWIIRISFCFLLVQ